MPAKKKKKMTRKEWIAAIRALPKYDMGTIDSDADYVEEMEERSGHIK